MDKPKPSPPRGIWTLLAFGFVLLLLSTRPELFTRYGTGSTPTADLAARVCAGIGAGLVGLVVMWWTVASAVRYGVQCANLTQSRVSDS